MNTSQYDRVLMMLRRGGTCTTADFLRAYIPRFSARILELREDGHDIETVRLRDGSYGYRLVEDADFGGNEPGGVSPHSGPDADGHVAAELSANSDESPSSGIANSSSGTTSAPGGGAETLFDLEPIERAA